MKQELYSQIVNYIIENQNKFYRLAFSYVHNEEDALDVVQNAICKALEHYEGLKNDQAIRTWFYRILVNESLLLLKKRKRECTAGDEEERETVYYEKGYDGEEDLYEYINHLDEDLQSIIKFRFFEELPLKEIAVIMGMNLNTVKAKLYRGLKLLKQELQEVEI